MKDNELLRLIKMVNQIAENFDNGGAEDEVATQVLDHVNRFWAPSMKFKVARYAERDGSMLSPPSRLAVLLIDQSKKA